MSVEKKLELLPQIKKETPTINPDNGKMIVMMNVIEKTLHILSLILMCIAIVFNVCW